jgi:hypothetical protein
MQSKAEIEKEGSAKHSKKKLFLDKRLIHIQLNQFDNQLTLRIKPAIEIIFYCYYFSRVIFATGEFLQLMEKKSF